MLRRVLRSNALLQLLILVVFLWPSILFAATSPISFSASGANGSGVSDQPGLACADGGEGASWHYGYSGAVSSGGFSSAATSLDLDLDLHSEGAGSPPSGGAWLPPESSDVLLQNSRGTLTLELSSGSGACGANTFFFDGTMASGSGAWVANDGTSSYREATGTGTFQLVASVGPGADNPFSINFGGQVAVLDPSLAVEVVSASWDNEPHSDFRYADVTFRLTNTGPGDSFGVELVDASTDTPGVALVGPVPQDLGDIAAGDEALATVRYQFDRGPCAIKDRGCALDVTLSVDLPDALDHPATHSETLRVHVPTAPQHG